MSGKIAPYPCCHSRWEPKKCVTRKASLWLILSLRRIVIVVVIVVVFVLCKTVVVFVDSRPSPNTFIWQMGAASILIGVLVFSLFDETENCVIAERPTLQGIFKIHCSSGFLFWKPHLLQNGLFLEWLFFLPHAAGNALRKL